MSKTDKTRPWHVQNRDGLNQLFEWHNHQLGPCDLEQFITEKDRTKRFFRCELYPKFPDKVFGVPSAGKQYRKQKHRAQRHSTRMKLGQLRYDTEGEEGMILPEPVSDMWSNLC